MDFLGFLHSAPLLLDFTADNERSALAMVANLLRDNPAIADHQRLFEAIWERHCLQPPLLGNGIALPHARTPVVTNIVFALGRCKPSISFGPDGQAVKLIFLYASPPALVTQSLAVMATLASRLKDPAVVAGLLAARNDRDFKQCLH